MLERNPGKEYFSLIGSLNKSRHQSFIILLCAHYDRLPGLALVKLLVHLQRCH